MIFSVDMNKSTSVLGCVSPSGAFDWKLLLIREKIYLLLVLSIRRNLKKLFNKRQAENINAIQRNGSNGQSEWKKKKMGHNTI